MSTSPLPLRIYFIPLPSPGHVIPMVDVAKLFAKHNVECTLILTPLNASRLNSTIYHSNLKLLIFEFPSVSGLPTGCASTDVLPSPDHLLEQPFRELVRRNPPDAVVSDAFFCLSVITSPELNIPHYSFPSTSCSALSVERSLLIYKPEQNVTSDSDPFLVPGMPGQIYLTKSLLLGKEKLTEFFNCARETKNTTVGWVANTFSELESEYIKHFERETGRPVFAVGPVCLSGTSKQDVAERGRGKNLVAESECQK